jgi:plastocyanin
MQRHRTRRIWALAVLAACGSGGDTGPSPSPVVAKSSTKTGDLQSGPVNAALPSELRVVVTRDGSPAADVTVTWATVDGGSLSPSSDQTDAAGLSTSIWTLGSTPGSQAATASVTNATGSPVTFTATATGGGAGGDGEIIQVLGPLGGANRFSPVNLTVIAGTTVTWQWADGAAGHNVVPDAGSIPAGSGDLASAPHSYQFTFDTPGTYHYHCAAHGTAGGGGMSGTVTVAPAAP